MGFLARLFKKEPARQESKSQAVKVELKLEDLLKWINDSNSVKIEHLKHELSELWKEVLRQVSDLQSAIKDLQNVKFEPNDKTYAAVNMSKDLFTKKSQLLNKIPKSTGSRHSQMKEAHTTTAGIISDVKEANYKQAYIISNYFKKEADQIIRILKNVDNLLVSFDKKLNSDGEILKVTEEVENKLDEHNNVFNDLAETETSLCYFYGEIEKQKNLLSSLNSDLEKINADSLWTEMDAVRKQASSLDSELQKLRYAFNEEISSVRKPLKKVLHDADSLKIRKEDKTILSQELEIETMESSAPLLKAVDSILTNSVDLKSAELAKINSLRTKITSGELDGLRNKYNKLLAEKMEKESELGSFELEKLKQKKEAQINEAEDRLYKLKKEEDHIEKQKTLFQNQMEKALNEIKSLILEKLNKEITLTAKLPSSL